VHFRPWGLAPFLPMPTSDLCDRPATLEQIWSRQAVAELRYRLILAERPYKMLKSVVEERMRQLRVIDGLELVRQVSTALDDTDVRMPINYITPSAPPSTTHSAKHNKTADGVTPKRLARSCRFTSTVLAIDVAASIEWSRIAAD